MLNLSDVAEKRQAIIIMTRHKNYLYKSKSKKNRNKVLTISLIISGVILSGLVVWVGMNDWDLQKSYKEVEHAIASVVYPEKKESDEGVKEQPEEVSDIETPEEKVPEQESPENQPPKVEVPEKDNRKYIEEQELPKEPTYIEGILIANKQYPLPSTYAPGEDKEARSAFNEMAAAAKLDGFELIAFSTYRSYDYQTGLYERYVERDGKEAADRYSARPGYSEHQTGLAFDIGEVDQEQYFASSEFGDTDAGKWVASNAHRFGFIMRYPEGKENVTGYMYESWHFRYVGVELAEEIYQQNISLEEYLGI